MFAVAFVGQFDVHAVIQEGKLADAFGKDVEAVFDIAEGFRAGKEAHGRAFFVGIADNLQRLFGFAAYEADEVFFAVAVDGQCYPVGQCVDDGDAYAVQAAGDFVAVVVEFAACVQDGHDDFGGGAAFFRMDAGRHAAAVVGHADGIVGMDGYGDFVAMSGERFVNGVVEHLEHHVVQAAAVLRVADIHTRAFAYRFQAFQHLYAVGAVFFVFLVSHGLFLLNFKEFFRARNEMSNGRGGCVPKGQNNRQLYLILLEYSAF